jgi:hypothetical protein
MLKRNVAILFIFLIAAFVFGLVNLFQLRVDDGDIYPPYSSLRADPLGARAYYESLAQVGGLNAERLYVPLSQAGSGRGTTLMLLGTPADALTWVTETDVTDLENFMRDGGRVVISIFPINSDPAKAPGFLARHERRRRQQEQEEEKELGKKKVDKKEKSGQEEKTDKKPADEKDKSSKDSKKKKEKMTDDEEEMQAMQGKHSDLTERWGMKFKYNDLPVDTNNVTTAIVARRMIPDEKLTRAVSWHTALYFDEMSTNWNTIYSAEGHTVMIERSFGGGSLTFVADSYFLSNEGLRKDRATGLLAWLVGKAQRVLFDETHLGVEEQPGIATLVRRYQLHWLAMGFLLLALLFIWKNATSFVPALEDRGEISHELETGKDSASGFVNLLRRNVPGAEILNVCLAEWKKSFARNRLDLKPRIERVESIAISENARPSNERTPVAAYQEMSRILTQRK